MITLMLSRLIYFLFFIFTPLYSAFEEPWGKDIALISLQTDIEKPSTCKTLILGPFSEIMIGFHQNIISPADGPRSHFLPSSSQYTLDSMRQHGFFKGFLLGCDRLMRENSDPWIYPKRKTADGSLLKWDPVQTKNTL